MHQSKERKKEAVCKGSEASEPTRRDPERTRRSILEAARSEFCQHGFGGARIERISRKSKANMRMIYHYFGNKEGVYLSVLEAFYSELRNQERALDLTHSDPLEGMKRLVLFSFDFFASRSDFVALINTENILKAHYLKRLPSIQAMSVPLIDAIRDLLERGQRDNVFRDDVDALQLYISIVGQSQIHLSNRHTLSVLFDQNLSDKAWLQKRRDHTVTMILAFLTSQASENDEA